MSKPFQGKRELPIQSQDMLKDLHRYMLDFKSPDTRGHAVGKFTSIIETPHPALPRHGSYMRIYVFNMLTHVKTCLLSNHGDPALLYKCLYKARARKDYFSEKQIGVLTDALHEAEKYHGSWLRRKALARSPSPPRVHHSRHSPSSRSPPRHERHSSLTSPRHSKRSPSPRAQCSPSPPPQVKRSPSPPPLRSRATSPLAHPPHSPLTPSPPPPHGSGRYYSPEPPSPPPRTKHTPIISTPIPILTPTRTSTPTIAITSTSINSTPTAMYINDNHVSDNGGSDAETENSKKRKNIDSPSTPHLHKISKQEPGGDEFSISSTVLSHAAETLKQARTISQSAKNISTTCLSKIKHLTTRVEDDFVRYKREMEDITARQSSLQTVVNHVEAKFYELEKSIRQLEDKNREVEKNMRYWAHDCEKLKELQMQVKKLTEMAGLVVPGEVKSKVNNHVESSGNSTTKVSPISENFARNESCSATTLANPSYPLSPTNPPADTPIPAGTGNNNGTSHPAKNLNEGFYSFL